MGMRAVLSSGVAMLLGATAASATESNSLRGSASQAVAEAEEGKTLDALSDVFFSLAEGSEGESSGAIENTTESWDLSANAEVMKACSEGWSGALIGNCANHSSTEPPSSESQQMCTRRAGDAWRRRQDKMLLLRLRS